MNRKDKEIIDILGLIKKINELINDGETTSVVCPCCEARAKIIKERYSKNIRFKCEKCGIMISERFR